MQQCPKETIVRLFYDVSSSFLLLSIFFYFTSIFLAKLFVFFGANPFNQRNQDGFEFNDFSEEEMENEDHEYDYSSKTMEDGNNEHLVSDIIHGEENVHVTDSSDSEESLHESSEIDSEATYYSTPVIESCDDEQEREEVEEEIVYREEEILVRGREYSRNDYNDADLANKPTLRFGTNLDINSLKIHDATQRDKHESQYLRSHPKIDSNFRQDEDSLMFQTKASDLMGKKKHLLVQERGNIDHEIYGDTFTIGSTSKDSSEWRSSINCRDDSCTDDPFSSSSRRSCPKWESYTVFQKYDEEMLFLDRISAQKLHETESLRSIQACPRSISERIVYKFSSSSTNRKKRSEVYDRNPYHELESAYVAQICITWEALNWNYKYFQRLRASRREFDPGCPAYVAQQFQQFQVLLQRYVENEPYEHGRRPEIYVRMRSLAPKLLQVPEYRDSDRDDSIEPGQGSRIPSSSFLLIMEESIRTFMNFLKQDKKSHYQVLADLFKRRRRGTADSTLLFLLQKVNKKKKAKLNELRRSGKCLGRRRMRNQDEEVDILMALTDLKVVSRVLRMSDLNGEQLHWCENKMSKVKVSDGKLQRDSSPLFFPAH